MQKLSDFGRPGPPGSPRDKDKFAQFVDLQKHKKKGDRITVGKVINMMSYLKNQTCSWEKPALFSEGIHLEFDGGFELKYIFNHPTVKEMDAIKNGDPQFGIVIVKDVIFLLSRFGTLNWTDAPFNIHL